MAKHHYVPAFYLKKFCDINVPMGQEPYVWTAPRSGGDWSRRAPNFAEPLTAGRPVGNLV